MRLSQLARKLEISPSDLIAFFKKNKIGEYNSYNNKIEEKDISLALNHYNPDEIKPEIKEQGLSDLVLSQDIQNKNTEINSAGSESKSSKSKDESVYSESNGPEEEIELISMPKIKLEGVKVVGKIDLPEPVRKVKEEKNAEPDDQNAHAENDSSTGSKSEYRKTRKRTSNQKKKQYKSRRELSYEDKLKREERKKILEQERSKKIKKEQKKKHYIKNIQSNITPPIKKKKSRSFDEQESEPIKTRPNYKNPLMKFWAWLNGEYD